MPSERLLPPLAQLLAFEAAARHRSFSAAAAALGTSQPAVSQRIAALEGALGVTLFQRTPRGVAPTPEGAGLFAALREGLDVVEAAVAKTRSERRRHSLTAATDFGFAAFWLLPRLASLREPAPDLDVRVMTAQGELDLHREPVDVLIAFGPAEWPGCAAEPLFPEIVLAICAPGRHERPGPPTAPAARAALPLLHLEAGDGRRWLDWPGFLAALGCPPAGRGEHGLTINNYPLLIQAALAGQGVALGRRPLVDDLLASGQLRPAWGEPIVTERGYHLVHANRRDGSSEVRLFRRWLQAEVARAGTPLPEGESLPPRAPTRGGRGEGDPPLRPA